MIPERVRRVEDLLHIAGKTMNRSDGEPMAQFEALVLVGQLGIGIAAPIVAGVLAGVYLEGVVPSGGLVLIAMIVLGIAGGAFAGYRAVARYLD